MSQDRESARSDHRRSHTIPGEERHPHSHWHISVPLRIIFGLLFLIALGTILLMLPVMAAERPLTFMEALFTATSALTVTGLTTITASTSLSFTGQVLLLFLIQLGGVGYMFAASVALLLLGRRIRLNNRLALVSSIGLDQPGEVQRLFKRVLFGILAFEGLGAILLYIYWQTTGIVSGNRAIFYSIFHAISAFCNAGFDLFTGLAEYPDGIPQDNVSLLILAVLIIVGGLGIPVLTELLNPHRKRFTLHSRITLWTVVVLVIFGWVSIGIPEVLADGVLQNEPISEQLVRSFFHSVSTRTAGFTGLPNFDHLQSESVMMTMLLMFIGSAPASMGGGITTGTFAVLYLAVWGYAKGYPTAQVGGRSLKLLTVRRAGAILTIGISVVMSATWLLLVSHADLTIQEALFEVISAFATCGLSLNVTGRLNIFGQFVIMFVMFWGRLGILSMVLAIAKQGALYKPLVTYPEEEVLIG